MFKKRWTHCPPAPLLSLALSLAACGQTPLSTPPALPEIAVTASDSGVQAPATLESGLVAVTLKNSGQRIHYLELARLKPGATRAQVQAALDVQDAAALDLLLIEAGATSDVDPGGSNRVILDLSVGSYLLLDAGATLDAANVIAGTLNVTQRVGLAVPDPAYGLKVVGRDFAYEMPGTVKAGAQLWQFMNAGQQTHEISLVKLHDGKTMADVKAFLDGPNPDFGNAPGDLVGGNAPISGGVREFFTVSLTAGNYVALCGIPDPATSKGHFDLGMMTAFTVGN